MDVYEAVGSRRAVRAFTDRPVPREALCRVLSEAAWAPSGSNIQPWHVYVLTGARLTEIKRLAGERVAAGDPWDEREYEMYPAALTSPYRERKSAFGAQRPRHGPAAMGRRRHVPTDGHAAASRRRAAQLPADGVVGISQDGREGAVAPEGTHPLLRHVDRVRGRDGRSPPYEPGAARRDGHVRHVGDFRDRR